MAITIRSRNIRSEVEVLVQRFAGMTASAIAEQLDCRQRSVDTALVFLADPKRRRVEARDGRWYAVGAEYQRAAE